MAESVTATRHALLTAELEQFIHIVSGDERTKKIILFGSVARSEVEEWTDLDLVVVAETDLPFYERTRQILNNVSPKVRMDVIVYNIAEWEEMHRSRAFIKTELMDGGRVVYERGMYSGEQVG